MFPPYSAPIHGPNLIQQNIGVVNCERVRFTRSFSVDLLERDGTKPDNLDQDVGLARTMERRGLTLELLPLDVRTFALPHMNLLQLRFEHDSSTIRVRFEHDSATTRYEVFRALAYEIVYENLW